MTLALGACGDTDKAGGSGDEVTLRIGTDDVAGKPAARQIEEFARQAKAHSNGRIRVVPVYEAAGEMPDDWDQKVARLVTSGEIDGGMIPARAWDTEGVTTLRPLFAPFLLTSDEAVNRIISGPIASELLAGLDEAGAVGLALLPEGLRHPFGYEKALLGPEDYRGQGVRVTNSKTAYALFQALGARPDDPDGAVEDRMIEEGRLAAAESSFALAEALPVAAATGNVTFFPKVNSLVLNEDVWEDLSDEQRSQLRRAAESARDWAIENNLSETEAAERFCTAGGRIVMASEADLDALVEATRPVYDELERDERTAALIEKIRNLVGEVAVGDTTISACDGRAGSEATSGSAATSAGIPEGVYRTEVSVDELVKAGLDRSTATEYNGVHTLTLRDGMLEDIVKSDKPSAPCTGTYESTATTLELTFTGDCSGGFKAKWKLRGDTLSLEAVPTGVEEDDRVTRAVFSTNPFKKID